MYRNLVVLQVQVTVTALTFIKWQKWFTETSVTVKDRAIQTTARTVLANTRPSFLRLLYMHKFMYAQTWICTHMHSLTVLQVCLFLFVFGELMKKNNQLLLLFFQNMLILTRKISEITG